MAQASFGLMSSPCLKPSFACWNERLELLAWVLPSSLDSLLSFCALVSSPEKGEASATNVLVECSTVLRHSVKQYLLGLEHPVCSKARRVLTTAEVECSGMGQVVEGRELCWINCMLLAHNSFCKYESV